MWTGGIGDLWKQYPYSLPDWVLTVTTCPSLIHHAPSHVSALTSGGCFNMDNELQTLFTLLSIPAAVVHLQSAFYNATTVYMHRRQAII